MKSNRLKQYSIKLLLIAVITLFTFAPLCTTFFKMSPNDWTDAVKDKSFASSVTNSIIYSSIATFITLALATVSAYFLDRASFKHKKVIETLLTSALLIPSLSIGLGVKLMFGRNGFIDKLFNLNLQFSGFPMLVICSVIALFPVAFTTIYDALKYEDKNVYIAANVLGINQVSSFFHVTLPYLKMPLIYSAFSVFSITFCDYGIPMEVAGLVKTLSMYLYENMTSTLQYGRSSIAMLVLIAPSILLFAANLFIKNESDKKNMIKLNASKLQNILTIVLEVLLVLVLSLPTISFISLSFMKSFPIDMSFTFNNFIQAFTTNLGLSFTDYIMNSLKLSLTTATIGTIISFIFAYFSARVKDKISSVIDVMMTASLAIPGMALGICYVFFFKDVDFFYDTFAILVVVNIAHMIGSPYLLAKNALAKQNQDYENVAATLNRSKFSIFFEVLVPNSVSTILCMFSYFFITSMTTVTAVLFLSTYINQPLSVLITYYDKSLNYEMQAVISVCILVINILCKSVFDGVAYFLQREKKVKHKQTKHEVKRAIVLAAGFGSRMQPLTFTTPKPLIKVNGKPIIETLLDNLIETGITDIILVVGYKKEQFTYLKKKYHCRLIENKNYNSENNISSLYVAREYLDRCYICEADLLLSNNVFRKEEERTCFLGFHCYSSNDWCATFDRKHHYKIKKFGIGSNEECFQTCGISYWSYEDARQLRKNLEELYNSNGGKECIWDMAAFNAKYKKTISVYVRPIFKSDIKECDSIEDLAAIDKSYSCLLS